MARSGRPRRRIFFWLLVPVVLAGVLAVLLGLSGPSSSRSLKVLRGLGRGDHRLDVYEYRMGGIGMPKKASSYAFETEIFNSSKTISELRAIMDADIAAPKPTLSTGSDKYYFYNWNDKATNRSRTLTLYKEVGGNIRVSYTELREASIWDRFRSWLNGFGRQKPRTVMREQSK